MVARTQPRQPRGDHQGVRPAIGLLHAWSTAAARCTAARWSARWPTRASFSAAVEHGQGPGQGGGLFPPARHRHANKNSGGSGVGAAAGALGGLFGGFGRAVGAIAGGINVKKGEANVTLSLVNARTTEEEALTEGYFRKRDLSFAVGGGAGWWGGFAAAGGGGYQNTEIGQIIVLAYLDAYKKLVTQLGGYSPAPAAAGAVGPTALKKAAPDDSGAAFFAPRRSYQAIWASVGRRRRRIAMPIPAKPKSIMAQVAASGTGADAKLNVPE